VSHKTDHYLFWTRVTFLLIDWSLIYWFIDWFIDLSLIYWFIGWFIDLFIDLLIYWFIDLSLHTDTLPSINQLSKSKNHGRSGKIVYFIKDRKRINRTGFFWFFLIFLSNINIEFQKFQKSQITTLIEIFQFFVKLYSIFLK